MSAPLPSPRTASPPLKPAPTMSAPPINMEQLMFRVKQVNAHTVFNKWTTVDETAHFAMQNKERKAITTSQCRIIVKGAKHFPLQLSDGPSVEHLYTTWQYVRQIEEVIPRDLSYKEVEKWVQLHVRELIEAQDAANGVDGSERRRHHGGGGGGDGMLDDSDDGQVSSCESEEGGEEGNALTPRPSSSDGATAAAAAASSSAGGATSASPPRTNGASADNRKVSSAAPGASGGGAAGQAEAPEVTLSFKEAMILLKNTMFLAARRPTTKEEWRRRDEVIAMARRNRTIATMVFFTIYTLLMRYMSFDGYLLLLVFLQIFLFYITTFYREIAFHFARRAAEKRVDRAKDWFFFKIRGADARKNVE